MKSGRKTLSEYISRALVSLKRMSFNEGSDIVLCTRFRFTVSNPRWGHDDTYYLDVHEEGWTVSHMAINGDCDPSGEPYLYRNFRQDGITYPGTLGWYMRRLFEHVKDSTLQDDEIQRRLDRLAQWVNELNTIAKPEF